eukprot:gb/GECH01014397.1/.p1 GENE.gb/GECH01014397.1/~~gb/GECH01014397.1/.p1  ORF type:complete len:314 (+),score=57.01 gb/GECH01014397.1/:1-942(+)
MSKTQLIVGISLGVGILLCIGILLTVILVPISIHTVRYDQYGLDHNKITRKVDLSRIYNPGRYTLGVGHKFIHIPQVVLTIDYSFNTQLEPVYARTKDGLTIDLDVSLQYRIERDKIISVFKNFAGGYKSIVDQIARNAIRNTASRYDAIDFFEVRQNIAPTMKIDLQESLNAVDITVVYLQLRGVNLPDQYEDIIESKEIERQRIELTSFEQQTALVNANTSILVASRTATKVKIDAEANAEATRIRARGDAYEVAQEVDALATGLEALQLSTNMSVDDLISYSWFESIQNNPKSSLIVNLDHPAIISIPEK